MIKNQKSKVRLFFYQNTPYFPYFKIPVDHQAESLTCNTDEMVLNTEYAGNVENENYSYITRVFNIHIILYCYIIMY